MKKYNRKFEEKEKVKLPLKTYYKDERISKHTTSLIPYCISRANDYISNANVQIGTEDFTMITSLDIKSIKYWNGYLKYSFNNGFMEYYFRNNDIVTIGIDKKTKGLFCNVKRNNEIFNFLIKPEKTQEIISLCLEVK